MVRRIDIFTKAALEGKKRAQNYISSFYKEQYIVADYVKLGEYQYQAILSKNKEDIYNYALLMEKCPRGTVMDETYEVFINNLYDSNYIYRKKLLHGDQTYEVNLFWPIPSNIRILMKLHEVGAKMHIPICKKELKRLNKWKWLL